MHKWGARLSLLPRAAVAAEQLQWVNTQPPTKHYRGLAIGPRRYNRPLTTKGHANAHQALGQVTVAVAPRDGGAGRAPHRSYYYAMGLTEDEIDQPFVGVATCWNEAAPCNIALSRQAQSVKKGVNEAGGTPREFTTITVTDGIAMGHQGMKSSLVSRDLIADFVELTMRGHCYDALVGLAGCDKSLPG